MKITRVLRGFHWFITIFIFFYILTGFGISHYQILEPGTFGLLSKALSFQLHSLLIYPMIFVLILHVMYTSLKGKIIRLFNSYDQQDDKEEKMQVSEKMKKLFVWLLVIFISAMMVFLVVAQPRFYTFVD